MLKTCQSDYMIRSFTLFFAFLFSISLWAQQAPQYSLYMLNKYAINPAYAGIPNSLVATGVYRKQWVDLEGSPSQNNINAHMPLFIAGGGIGINIENESLGVEQNTLASLSYNYFIPIGKKSVLSLGLSGGLFQKSLDGARIRTPDGIYDPNDPGQFNHLDELLPLNKIAASSPVFNIGIYFQNESLEVGLSSSNINESVLSLEGNKVIDIQLKRNYFFIFAYNLEVGRRLSIEPSVLFKSDIVQNELHFSAIATYDDNFFGGFSFRGYNSNTIDAAVFLAGFKINERLKLAYSYDLTLSDLKTVNNGSHEILLNYDLGRALGKGIPPKIIHNPRFL